MMKGRAETTHTGANLQLNNSCDGLLNRNYSSENSKIKSQSENFAISLDDIANIDLFDGEEISESSSLNQYYLYEEEQELHKYSSEKPYFYYDYVPGEIKEQVSNYEKQVEFLYDRIRNEPFGLGFLRSKVKYNKETGKPTRFSVRKHYNINPFSKGNKLSRQFKRTLAKLYIKKTPFKEVVLKLKKDGIIPENTPFSLIKSRFYKFAEKLTHSTSDLYYGIGYVNPMYFDKDAPETNVGLGAVLKKNSTILEYFIFSTNPNNFTTTFLYSGIVSGDCYGYPPRFPVYPRNAETAYIHKKSSYVIFILDIDVSDKTKDGKKVLNPEKQKFAISFIHKLKDIFNNVFVRYSRSGVNYHVLIIVKFDELINNKTLFVKQIYKLMEAMSVVVNILPYDKNVFDYARLFFGSPYPFVPVKFKDAEPASTFAPKFVKAVEEFVEEYKDKFEEDLSSLKKKIREVYSYIMSSGNQKELDKRVENVKYEYKIRDLEIKSMKRLSAKDLALENPTEKDIINRLNKFKKALLRKKEKISFFNASFEALKYIGADVYLSKNGDYYKFRISPNENTPYDVYLYYDDVRYFYLQSENSIRHFPEHIIYVKLSNGKTTIVIPYSEYKHNLHKYNKYTSIRYVIPNFYFDVILKTLIKNFYNLDVEVDVLKYIASRISRRYYAILQSLKEELLIKKAEHDEGKIDNITIDLKRFGGKSDRYYSGLTDLVNLITSSIFPEEILGLKIAYCSRTSFVVEVVSDKGFEFLYKTLSFMQMPLLVNSYVFDDAILQINDKLDNEIMNFAYRIYRKWKLGAVATSLGYNPRYLQHIFDILASGYYKASLDELSYDKLFLLFLAGNKLQYCFDEEVNKTGIVKSLVQLYKRIFGKNVFEVEYDEYRLVA